MTGKGVKLTQLETTVRRIVGEIAAALTTDLNAKLDKPTYSTITVPASGWTADSTAGYPYFIDISVAALTAADRADVDFLPASQSTARECGLCPTTETRAGYLRLRAETIPSAAMTAVCRIEKG